MRRALLFVVLGGLTVSLMVPACGGSSDDPAPGSTSTPGDTGGTAGSGGSGVGAGGSAHAGAGGGTAGHGVGGASAGGASTGGASTGGASTGGASTGGASAGGASAGGSPAGGASTGGTGGSAGGAAGSTSSEGGTAGIGGTGAGGSGDAGMGGAAEGGVGGSDAGSGGTSAGGEAGAGGSSDVATPQCSLDASACQLHSDCCNCLVLGPGETAPTCSDTNCKASACELLGNPTVACTAGQCTLARSCDESKVTCKSTPPVCPAGMLAEVDETTTCWTTKCIAITECSSVGSCDDCAKASLQCVKQQAFVTSQHCIAIPSPCQDASCACMGPAVCTSPFSICNEEVGSLTCDCPTC